jgi:hypothetical protein
MKRGTLIRLLRLHQSPLSQPHLFKRVKKREGRMERKIKGRKDGGEMRKGVGGINNRPRTSKSFSRGNKPVRVQDSTLGNQSKASLPA